MTADVQRELAEALAPKRHSWDPDELRDIVTDLLPTVQRLIADAEKRAAAAALRDAWPSVWQVLDRHGQGRSAMTLEASHVVEARAAALDPQ